MPDMRDRKVWKVWDREVWPPGHYDAIYKIAQSPTTLHFPPLLLTHKNVSKIYFALTTVFTDDILVLLGG